MALRGKQEYIARDVNNISRVEDEGNIVSIEGNIFLYPLKKSHPILLLYSFRALCVILLSNNRGWLPAAILPSQESESLWDVATVTKVGRA